MSDTCMGRDYGVEVMWALLSEREKGRVVLVDGHPNHLIVPADILDPPEPIQHKPPTQPEEQCDS